MLEVINFSNLLNAKERDGKPKLDALEYSEILISLLYHLIEVAPLVKLSVPRTLYEDVVTLSMLAFMTTLLPEYGRDHSSYLLLSERLKKTIQDVYAPSTDKHYGERSLLLWAMVMSGVSVLKRKEHQWLLLLVLQACEQLGLHDWSAIRRHICGFPWIHTLHDTPGQQLWEDARYKSIERSS